jgi:hypothetical protein
MRAEQTRKKPNKIAESAVVTTTGGSSQVFYHGLVITDTNGKGQTVSVTDAAGKTVLPTIRSAS